MAIRKILCLKRVNMPWVNMDDLPIQIPSKREMDEVERYRKMKKTKPRFYADENFPERAIEVLRGWNFDVLTAIDADKKGHPDENHLAEARRLGRVLLTCDRDYLNERRFPLIHCSALVVFDFGSGTRSEIIRAFQCLDLVVRFPQFYDKWCKIDAKPDEWIEKSRFQDGSTSRERYRIFEGKLQVWINDEIKPVQA